MCVSTEMCSHRDPGGLQDTVEVGGGWGGEEGWVCGVWVGFQWSLSPADAYCSCVYVLGVGVWI